MVYMYHSFLIHSSADGHLGCFHVLAIINSAAMNTGVHISLSDLVSLVCMPRKKFSLNTRNILNLYLPCHKCYEYFPFQHLFLNYIYNNR